MLSSGVGILSLLRLPWGAPQFRAVLRVPTHGILAQAMEQWLRFTRGREVSVDMEDGLVNATFPNDKRATSGCEMWAL